MEEESVDDLSNCSSSPSPTTTPPTPSPPPADHHHSLAAGDVIMTGPVGSAAVALAPPLPFSPSARASASDDQLQQHYSAGNNQLNTPRSGTPTNSISETDGGINGPCKPFSLTSPSPSSSSPLTTATLTTTTITTTTPTAMATATGATAEKRRGRPPGSGKRHLLATLGDWFAYSAGRNFTPHVVTIAAGEDVAARIMSFSQKGPRAICILSANGAISNFTLRQPGSSGGTLTYEGRFEILSLSGSFTVNTENSGACSRTGGISVSLAGPDGRVVGGGVAGLLLAATPIQVVVGSFLPNTFKEHRKRSNPESWSISPHPASIGTLTAARPLSQVNPDDDCQTPISPLREHVNHGEAENSKITNPNSTSTSTSFHPSTVGWHGLQLQSSSSEHKPSPDINLSLESN